MKFSIKYLMLPLSIMVAFSNYCNNANATNKYDHYHKFILNEMVVNQVINPKFVKHCMKAINTINVQDYNQTVKPVAANIQLSENCLNNHFYDQNDYIRKIRFVRQFYNILFETTHVNDEKFKAFISNINNLKALPRHKKTVYKWLLYCSYHASMRYMNNNRHDIILDLFTKYYVNNNHDIHSSDLCSYIANMLIEPQKTTNYKIRNAQNNDKKHDIIKNSIVDIDTIFNNNEYHNFKASETKHATAKIVNYTIAEYLIKYLVKVTINTFPDKRNLIRNSDTNKAANELFYMMKYVFCLLEKSIYHNLCNQYNIDIDKDFLRDLHANNKEQRMNALMSFIKSFDVMRKFLDELNITDIALINMLREKLYNYHYTGRNNMLLNNIKSQYVIDKVLTHITKV